MNQLDPIEAIAKCWARQPMPWGGPQAMAVGSTSWGVTDNANPRVSQQLAVFLALACAPSGGS